MKRMNRRRSTGATLVEAAIAFPVVLLIFLLVVDAFIYMARLGILNYAAQEAATLTSTVEGLRSADLGTRTAALQRVRERGWRYASWAIGDPAYYRSPGGENPPVIVTVANEDVPIRVELHASYVPLNPLLRITGPILIRAQALAYREEASDPGSPLPNCVKNDPRPECQCSGGRSGSSGQSFCSCPGGFMENELGQCVCIPPDCIPPKTQNLDTCQCVCPERDCGDGYYYDLMTCTCRCSTQECGQFRYWDPNYCRCNCDCWNLQQHCRSQNPRQWADCNTCTCRDQGECTPPTCNPPWTYYNEDACRCECPRPNGDGVCHPLNRNSYYDWGICGCKCRPVGNYVGTFPNCDCPSDYCAPDYCTRVVGNHNRIVTRTNTATCTCECDCPEGMEPTGPDSCGGGSG